MFHIGKILHVYRASDKDVIASDSSVQATVEMWDNHLLTIGVKSGIGAELKQDDVVLIDYAPSSQNIPVPKQVAVKILRGETAKKTWGAYKEFWEKKKRDAETAPQPYNNVR
ncbi:MAG: hypothetical protein JW772_01025 [Candidatus Diapherotrites archaeon]|nr:hypothetical protein [Candidatus Diapherotrites archaeon]